MSEAEKLIKEILETNDNPREIHSGYDDQGNYVYENALIVSDQMLKRMKSLISNPEAL